MGIPQSTTMRKQSGAVLMIALVFLVAITLLTTSSMRSSNIGLFMAHNEESRVTAEQAAQALADVIVANPSSTPEHSSPPSPTSHPKNSAGNSPRHKW